MVVVHLMWGRALGDSRLVLQLPSMHALSLQLVVHVPIQLQFCLQTLTLPSEIILNCELVWLNRLNVLRP